MTLRRTLLPSLALAALTWGCGKDEGTSPPRPVTVRVVASVPATHPEGPSIAIADARVRLHPRPGAQAPLEMSTTRQGDSLMVSWSGVPPRGATEWIVEVDALGSDGSTLFAGVDTVRPTRGDTLIVARPALRYVGADSALASLRLSPRDTTLAAGDTLQLQALPLRADLTPLASARIGWRSRDATIAAVDDAGRVRAVATSGETWIVARGWNGVADSVAITVTRQPAARIVVTPDTVRSAQVGDSIRLVATQYDRHGNVLADRFVSWSSSRPSFAPVTSRGVVYVVARADTQIVARIVAQAESGAADTTIVLVAPGPWHWTAYVSFSAGGSVPQGGDAELGTVICRPASPATGSIPCPLPPTFRSVPGYPGVAGARINTRVYPIPGGYYVIFTGYTPGLAAVVAEVPGLTPDTAIVTVLPSALELSEPSRSSLAVGQSTTLTVTAPRSQFQRTVQFTPTNPGVLFSNGSDFGFGTIPAGATSTTVTFYGARVGQTRLIVSSGDGLARDTSSVITVTAAANSLRLEGTPRAGTPSPRPFSGAPRKPRPRR